MFNGAWKIAVAGALVAVALGGATFASAQSSGLQPANFKVFDHTVKNYNVNVGAKSFGVGDSFIFNDQLWTTDKTKRVGSAFGDCTAVQLSGHTGQAHCLVTLTFRGMGTLEAAGLTPFSNADIVIAMTGGTGRFANARGQFHVHKLPGHNGNDAIISVEFVD